VFGGLVGSGGKVSDSVCREVPLAKPVPISHINMTPTANAFLEPNLLAII
jgi:hypothetical protein